jgi:rhodanese-related sulfurtransferase
MKWRKTPKAAAVLLVMLVISACASAGDRPYTLLSPEDAARMIADNRNSGDFVILDIRTPKEYRAGHIADARLLDFYSPQFPAGVEKLEKDKTYLIYCRTGNRTGKAQRLFAKAGLEQVYELAGGISAWAAAKKPMVQ